MENHPGWTALTADTRRTGAECRHSTRTGRCGLAGGSKTARSRCPPVLQPSRHPGTPAPPGTSCAGSSTEPLEPLRGPHRRPRAPPPAQLPTLGHDLRVLRHVAAGRCLLAAHRPAADRARHRGRPDPAVPDHRHRSRSLARDTCDPASAFVRCKPQRDRFDAVPLVRGRRIPLALEHMPKVRPAPGAPHLGAHHPVRAVLDQFDRVGVLRVVERRPAGALRACTLLGPPSRSGGTGGRPAARRTN